MVPAASGGVSANRQTGHYRLREVNVSATAMTDRSLNFTPNEKPFQILSFGQEGVGGNLGQLFDLKSDS
jgi:hypothetical protein